MAEVTVRQFADVLKVPVERLLGQLRAAGITVGGAEDIISDDAKMELLQYLREANGRPESARETLANPVARAQIRSDAPEAVEFERNAFAVLGATLRDNRQRLIDLAEERALTGDEAEIDAARSELTNPRTRLQAEVGWMPGTSPAKVSALLKGLRQNPGIVRAARGSMLLRSRTCLRRHSNCLIRRCRLRSGLAGWWHWRRPRRQLMPRSNTRYQRRSCSRRISRSA